LYVENIWRGCSIWGIVAGEIMCFTTPTPSTNRTGTYINDHFKNRKEMRSAIYNSSIARKKGKRINW
jgi:hypothetical protein